MLKSKSRLSGALGLCLSLGLFSSVAQSQTVTVVQTAPTPQAGTATIEVRFTAAALAGPTARSAFQADFNIARPPVAAANVTVANGIVTGGAPVCVAPSPANSGIAYIGGGADTALPINAVGTVASPEVACTFTVPISATATVGATNIPVSISQTDLSGTETSSMGTLVLTITMGAGGNVNPTVVANPASGTITYTPGGTAAPIVLTPSGGSGTGQSTFGPCTISMGGAAFPTTTTNSQMFMGNTVTPANINLPNCVPQVAATNAVLTCPGTGGAPATSTYTLVCPAAVVGATPPTITYNPAPGATINVPGPAPANTVIQVGCPTDGAGATCGGTGTGPGATSTLDQLTAVYNGPPFSPTPAMVCLFINEAGAVLPGTSLDFIAGQLDAGDIRCSCPQAFAPEPFTVSVRERSPQTVAGVIRTFNIICGSGAVCPTLTAAPSSGTISLVNGGAAGLVTTYTVAGIQPGATQAINCVQSGATAGSTFTVTTNPTPLVLTSATPSGTVSATCTNSNLTTATATLTCTPIASAPGCTPAVNTFTLSCPGGVAPPTVNVQPVPAMGEQGRILLAALMLLLGLAVVGFRVRN